MRLPSECYQMQKTTETHLPHLSQPQLTGLALWVCGAILAGSACQNAVASALSPWGRLEQPAPVPQGVAVRRQRPDADSLPNPTGCHALLRAAAEMGPLLVEFGAASPSPWIPPARAIRPPPSSSAWCTVPPQADAIPVAWRIHGKSTQEGSWMDPTVELLQGTWPHLFPRNMTVIVLCDRGISSPKLWTADTRPRLASLYALTGRTSPSAPTVDKRLPALRFVSRPDTAWIGRGTAFSTPKAQRRCTLLVVWYSEQEEPWIILTDLAPDQVGPSWYALRFWIELGFKALKSLGWKWDKTRRTDPTRVSRHWLVLSVATLLALAYGTRVEDAQERRIAPGNLRTPPKALAPNHRDPWSRPARTVSVIRHGIDWLRRLLLKGRLWSRVWLLPEPWPEPKLNLEITRHVPP